MTLKKYKKKLTYEKKRSQNLVVETTCLETIQNHFYPEALIPSRLNCGAASEFDLQQNNILLETALQGIGAPKAIPMLP